MHNVQHKGHRGQTPWELRFGTPFPAACIPFGCLVHYLPTNPKDKNTGVHKFEPSARQGVFIGYHMHAGSRWSKDYLVLDLIKIRTGKPIYVYRTTRVVVPQTRSYPLKDLPAETQLAHTDAGGADPEPLSEEQLPEERAVVIDQPLRS